tara:strand:- start:297 stop:1058 length:762 start_codon:yes stop_codon:yes gene_type:complete
MILFSFSLSLDGSDSQKSSVIAKVLTGRDIMKGVYDHAKFHKTQKSEIMMVIQDKKGKKRNRHFVLRKKHKLEETRTLIKFFKPANIKGTSLLTQSDEETDEKQQWIYFPSFKSVKKLSSKQKHDSFMGSDFTYSDIGGRQLDQDEHVLVKQDNEYFYLKSTPKDEEDHYLYMIMVVSKKEQVARKIVFYNREKEKLKTLYNKTIKNIKGGYLVFYSKMVNHLSESETHLNVKKLEVGIKLDDAYLGMQGLQD